MTATSEKSADAMVNAAESVDPMVLRVRAFNRFYTHQAGVLDRYLGSELSLTEIRVMYELAHAGVSPPLTANGAAQQGLAPKDLTNQLGLDAGYLSRILKAFAAKGWIARLPHPENKRTHLIHLTPEGWKAYAPLLNKSNEEVAEKLAPLSPDEQDELSRAMDTIERVFSSSPPSLELRNPEPGDHGWVVAQHGKLYASEYKWDASFEALVADIAAGMLRSFDTEREKGWIAHLNGKKVGSIFLVRSSDEVAKIRLLLVSPAARGLGLGSTLVDEALAFAKDKGYRRVELWTHSCLKAARRIYSQRGFQLIQKEPYVGFGGHELVGEHWALDLA